MEVIKDIVKDAERALKTLEEIIGMPNSKVVRDAAIQRFEYTFEIIWKLLKEYLKVREGIICNSPKSCFREAFNLKFLEEDESIKALEMTDDRNFTAHTYHEELADEIYGRIDVYYKLMSKLYQSIRAGI